LLADADPTRVNYGDGRLAFGTGQALNPT